MYYNNNLIIKYTVVLGVAWTSKEMLYKMIVSLLSEYRFFLSLFLHKPTKKVWNILVQYKMHNWINWKSFYFNKKLFFIKAMLI